MLETPVRRSISAIIIADDHQESDVDFLVDIEEGRTLLDVIALGAGPSTASRKKVEVLTEGA